MSWSSGPDGGRSPRAAHLGHRALLTYHEALAKQRKPTHTLGPERKGKRGKTITRAFNQEQSIATPDTAQPDVPANPYPSSLRANGFKRGEIVDLNLTLHGLQHESPLDVDILLVKNGVAV